MTIKSRLSLLLRRTGVIFTVLLTWLVASALVMRFSELAPGALVMFPDKALVNSLPDHVRILSLQSHRLVVTSDRIGYVGELYALGARLVLPARKNGCVSMQIPGMAPVMPGKLTTH